MELKPGYKLTEVGVIPEDWEVRRLSEHFSIYAGGDVPKQSLSQTQSASHPYPIFANALQDRGLYGYTNEQRSKKDSLTITARGYLGHAEYRDEPYFPIVRLLVLEPTGHLDARYTTYAINDRVTFAIESTGVPQLTAPQVRKYSVASPPTLPEQRAIAEALSDVDALLGGLDRLIAKKRDLKQAAMQQLLTGQTRLPEFSEECEVKRLEDAVEKLVGGGTPNRSEPAFWGSEVPWVTVKDFATFHPRETQESVTWIGLKNSASHLIPAGTLITSTRMALGKAVIYEVDVAINQDLKAVFLKPNESALFLYYWFQHNAKMIDDLGSGSTVKGISILELKGLPFPHLSPDEQTAIAAVLSDMDAEIVALEARRDKTRLLKQGMMQELLTGKTRLI